MKSSLHIFFSKQDTKQTLFLFLFAIHPPPLTHHTPYIRARTMTLKRETELSINSMEFDLENPLPHSNDIFSSLFHIEIDHMPSKNYIQTLTSSSSYLSVRHQIASSIVHISRHSDPFLPYLAVNYMDRFLSAHPIPPWIFRLVAVSCISLALKMRKTEKTEYSVFDLMDDGGLMFDSLTIERMEMLILGALKWRMRSVSPFSFLGYFVSFFDCGDDESVQALRNRGTQIILKSQSDIKLLEFKPSIVSASALLLASREFFPTQFEPFRDAICGCIYLIKEELQHCYDVMAEAEAGCEVASTFVSESLTPPNVLDFSCSISETDSNQMSEGVIDNSTTNKSTQLSQGEISD
ncbi:putative cyclin-D6-1 isoform X2 [Salvia splendens]|uniref:putative cyclin-D6-1 isoform X2 n=1 Tax=Salvia splendens TaxID=180675 RepID=UPI001C275B92|nr:putative cyclin-D6-1 isoform X2 [Salvia splendens]